MNKPKNNLIERPPVVVIMGHIDHGKSTLLDYIRKTNVTAGEAGGITQHIAAYEVTHKNGAGITKKITFLDTPGHEAFQGIRARGATVADIAVLVISAEDGVKPQTLEALKCIKEAQLPYIVALNKIDRPGANVERAKQNLAEHEIYIEGYGGDVPTVPISAVTGAGIKDLLDMILLVAEVSELKGDESKNAEGVVIEASLDTKKGVSATLIIKDGHIEKGKCVVAQNCIAPVRLIEDFLGNKIDSAGLSVPVKVIGWNVMPPVGSLFKVYDTKKEAEKAGAEYKEIKIEKISKSEDHPDGMITIPLIIKADVTGSLEGIKHELEKIKNDRVKIKIVSEGVGNITENDIKFATGTESTIVVNFHAGIDTKAKIAAERLNVEIKTFDIIYKLAEFIEETVKLRTPKIQVEESTGKAKIIRVFSRTRDKQIVGGKVQEGEIIVGSEVKILRRDVEIGRGKIRELQQAKTKAHEVREGFEFGTMIESKIEIAEGDKVECFRVVEK